MSDSRYLRKGSKVTINLTPNDYAVTTGMLEYNGKEAVISKVCRKKSKSRIVTDDSLIGKQKMILQAESSIYGYELENVVSKYGIPYTFTKDMLY